MTSKYFCDICNVDFHTWQDCGNHKHKVESPVSRYQSDLHLAKGIPFCKVCSLKLDSFGQMLGHVEKHEKERKMIPRNVMQSDDDDDKLESNNNNAVDVKTLVLLDRSGRNVNVQRLESLSKQLDSEENDLTMDKQTVEEETKLCESEGNTLNSMTLANMFVERHLIK